MSFQCFYRPRADALSGRFRSIDSLRSFVEFKFKFQIRNPFRLWLGTTSPQLHLGKFASCPMPASKQELYEVFISRGCSAVFTTLTDSASKRTRIIMSVGSF
jgi:hypothetical protein